MGNVVRRLRERSKSWLVVPSHHNSLNPNLGITRNIILLRGCFSRSFSPMLLPWTVPGEDVFRGEGQDSKNGWFPVQQPISCLP